MSFIRSGVKTALLALVAGSVVSCADDGRDREREEAVASMSAALSVGTTLQATGDTYLRNGAPNQNMGGDMVLRVQSSGNNRPLVFFDNAAILTAIGSGTLTHADLELTIDNAGSNWGTTGRPIGMHRLKQASAEYNATWNCAIDANVTNGSADCSGANAWNMASSAPSVQPYVSPASATATITNGMTGVVRFDVTADVAAIAGGTWGGYGFLIRKVDEGQNGAVDFKSRERGDGARLVLTVEQAAPPPPAAGSGVPAQNTVSVIRDSYVAQGEPNQVHGAQALLRIKSSGRNRGLVAVDPAQVLASLAGGPLNGAHLELTIAQTYSNWGPDRAIGAHLLRASWSEPGATWNCASDSNPSNSQPDCSGADAWTMWGALPPGGSLAWVDPPSGTAVIGSAQTGVVRLDVTTDVACYLAGYSGLPGWLIKKEAEQESGRVELASRETATPPVLVIEHGIGPGVSVSQAQCAGTTQPPPSCTPTGPDDDCDNVDDDCDAVKDDDYTVTTTSCGTGACAANGESSCVNGAVVNSCVAGSPSSDNNCDGIDQDCDGTVDDEYAPITSSCGSGVCASSAVTACVGSHVSGGTCTPGSPTGDDSACNGINEDCDGNTDEAYVPVVSHCGTGVCANSAATACVNGAVTGGTCVPGSPTSNDSACNGINEDCDGNTDEAYAPVVSHCGTGVCASSAATACVNGAVTGGTCTEGTPTGDDLICDGVDEDCDGHTDESYAPVVSHCGTGVCARSASTVCAYGSVVGGTCAEGSPTGDDSTCDGLDDDCDGHVDEGYVPVVGHCGTGVCASSAATACVGGVVTGGVCTAGSATGNDSICDGLDDDCDGHVDESYAPVVSHCGTGVCASSASTACVDGAITGGTCSPGSATGNDSICDGLDNDCDGHVDESYAPVVNTCGAGLCANSAATACVGGVVTGGTCSPGSPTGNDSVCDGIDDDCDGSTDESYAPVVSQCGIGVCASSAVTACESGTVTGGVCVPASPSGPDTNCDGFDQDCDGHSDESYVPVPTQCQVQGCQATGVLACQGGSTVNTCLTGPTCTAELACGDAADNDSDTFTDCADSDCNAAPSCAPQTGTVVVSGKANIFGAGHASPPGSSPGILPPLFALNYGANAVVTVSATGIVKETTAAGVGPDGAPGAWPVPSTPSIAGYNHMTLARSLVGVFLGPTEPVPPAPPQLTFADGNFTTLHPALHQVFFIGNGSTASAVTQRFYVPAGATRLALGMTDLCGTTPVSIGCFNDNTGSYTASLVVHPNDSF